MNLLSALALINKFDITITENEDGSYHLSCGAMVAVIDAYGTSYYVSGVYNSGMDYAEIEMENLDAIKEIAQILEKEV